MSKEVMSAVIRGATNYVNEAEKMLKKAVAERGADCKFEFPATAYFLPMAHAILGLEVKNIGEMQPILEHCQELLPQVPADNLWYPYLGDGLDAGMATLLSTELITALRYLSGWQPAEGQQGFINDTILRELGIQLVDGRMPGFAAILGPAPTNEIAVNTVRELQKRSILTFTLASRDGKTFYDQLKAEGVEMGWDTYVVPVGPEALDGIHVLNWAMRGSLTFGGLKKGDWEGCLRYTRERIFAFGITFGEIPDDWYAIGAAAIVMGFPVISDSATTPEVLPTGVTTYEALVVEEDYEKLISTCIRVRGVKVKIEEIDIPVSYAAAYEGERVRKEDMYVQFGGKYSNAFELVKTAEGEITDGDFKLIGPDIDSVKEGDAMDLGVVVEVSGRSMQKDFEGILERQMHRYINNAMGFMHTGQRDLVWSRVSKKSFAAGFRLEHLGTIMHAKLHDEYGGIVERVAVTVITDKAECEKVLQEARTTYANRDDRLSNMVDESVDTFYSCTICQSYAPSHVCVITPERLGLCGAYNWLDGKAAFEISPTGPNQPIKKGEVIDEKLGEWKGVNNFVYAASGRVVEHFSAYSMMTNPMTSCGCFECIISMDSSMQGVVVVNREYIGETPLGMPFSTLASSVGGGAQTPGFVGVGRLYLTSKKFISAEGGLARILWMPKDLKEAMRERLTKRAEEEGLEGFVDKIATEENSTDPESLLNYLNVVGHPAIAMEPMLT